MCVRFCRLSIWSTLRGRIFPRRNIKTKSERWKVTRIDRELRRIYIWLFNVARHFPKDSRIRSSRHTLHGLRGSLLRNAPRWKPRATICQRAVRQLRLNRSNFPLFRENNRARIVRSQCIPGLRVISHVSPQCIAYLLLIFSPSLSRVSFPC